MAAMVPNENAQTFRAKSISHLIQRQLAQVEMNNEERMEAVKIIMPTVEHKPCVCGAKLYRSIVTTNRRESEAWLCTNHCGARGLTYEGALRRKVRLDLLSWGDLRRNAQTLIEAEDQDEDIFTLQ